MNNSYSNPCIRCGTERITLKTWTEKSSYSTIINVEKICPNPDCQKEVDKDNKKQARKYAEMKLRSENRATNRKAANDAIRAEKKRKQS